MTVFIYIAGEFESNTNAFRMFLNGNLYDVSDLATPPGHGSQNVQQIICLKD
ncbi:hypothetical protein AAFX24_17665 [Vibrio mediterranei]|uniref:hypothetical protein n=1 Tax=Vibrio mediterranei TaxID=689 RepID=UPI0038CF1C80